jgi:large subunit ribosomal protein L9
MKVILRKDVDFLGEEGDIVTVKDGYARNYLLPKSYAVIATPGNLKIWENEKVARDRKIAKSTEKATEQAKVISANVYEIIAKVGDEGKLYGSVTTQDISNAIEAKTKIAIDRRKIHLEEQIKAVGEYTAVVKIYKDVKAEVKVVVKSEEEKTEAVAKEEKE